MIPSIWLPWFVTFNAIEWVMKLLGMTQGKCTHPNGITLKWINRDGVPMIDHRCPDCGERRYGEVPDADPHTWGTVEEDDDKNQ